LDGIEGSVESSNSCSSVIVHDAGRQAAHKINENTGFLVASRQTTFYIHVFKDILTFNAKKKIPKATT
jgi:hypothetical protein